MSVFKHIVITRFNLSHRWANDKYGNEVLDNEWLNDRYYLFENYCFPSIKKQTNQNFEWWVYFDYSLREEFKIKNSSFSREYPNFQPKYEKSYDDFETNMPLDIDDYIKSGNINWLITTRLDNDDVFAIDTIQVIQNGFLLKDMVLLELPLGLTLEICKKARLRKVRKKLNPFISLVEKVTAEKKIKSVYHHQHTNWKNIPIIELSNQVQWIQIIHQKNLINKAKGNEVLHFEILKRFNFNKANLIFPNIFEFYVRKTILYLKRAITKTKEFFIC